MAVELLTGQPPFDGDGPLDTFDQIQRYADGGDEANLKMEYTLRQHSGRGSAFFASWAAQPASISAEAAAFVAGLLQVDEAERLGTTKEGFLGIQHHAWFSQLDWIALLQKRLPSPLELPSTRHPFQEHEVDTAVLRKAPAGKNDFGSLFDRFGPTLKLGGSIVYV